MSLDIFRCGHVDLGCDVTGTCLGTHLGTLMTFSGGANGTLGKKIRIFGNYLCQPCWGQYGKLETEGCLKTLPSSAYPFSYGYSCSRMDFCTFWLLPESEHIQQADFHLEKIAIHETGLCKNLIQEYAQKMNYAIPSYQCSKQPSGELSFSCSVEVGGIQYIGAAAKTKKEAEIKAARTALLAIQSSSSGNEPNGVSQYTVLPGKKKGKEAEAQTEALQEIKTKKKVEFKKKWSKRKFPRNRGNRLKSNKMDDGTADGDASFIQFVNGGVLEADKSSYSGDQKIDYKMIGTTVREAEHPAMLSLDAGMSFHHADVPFVVDASTVPQVSQLGNSAILTE